MKVHTGQYINTNRETNETALHSCLFVSEAVRKELQRGDGSCVVLLSSSMSRAVAVPLAELLVQFRGADRQKVLRTDFHVVVAGGSAASFPKAVLVVELILELLELLLVQ
jgi:hypothetical protein